MKPLFQSERTLFELPRQAFTIERRPCANVRQSIEQHGVVVIKAELQTGHWEKSIAARRYKICLHHFKRCGGAASA